MRLPQKLKGMTQTSLQAVRQAFRGVLSGTKSNQSYQSVQVRGLDGEVIQDAEFYQHFGLTSNPPAGTKAIVIPLGGESSHSVIIATENGSFRVQSLKSGETCIYNESGASITLKQGRVIDIDCDAFNIKTKHYTCIAETHVTSSSGGITLDAPVTAITGSLSAGFGGARLRSSYSANFNMAIEAQDGVFGGISFLQHIHTDSISGDTTPPQ